MATNIRDVAQIAGVSPSTVSMVLNNKKGVNPETRKRIQCILDELNYSPEKSHTKKKRIEKVGILRYMLLENTFIEDQIFTLSVIESLYDECYRRGIHPSVQICNETNYIDIFQKSLSEEMDALIVLCFDMDADTFDGISHIDCNGVPLVFIGNGIRDIPFNTVNLSNIEDSYMAANYLYECGYRIVGYLHSSRDFRCFRKRKYGFLSAIDSLNMECPLILSMDSQIADAECFMTDWLKQKQLIPRAFFADNDNLALGAIRAFESAGYKVPKDISIIGMDDLVQSAFSSVPLTTIHISRQQISKSALDLLLWNLSIPVHIVCRGKIVVRESTRMFDERNEPSTLVCK